MRLIRLSANHASFRTIKFNKDGLTLIVGKQKSRNDSGKTFNGVGKSLAIALVHFCLGANSNPKLVDKISDWEFSLLFEIGGKEYIASRNTSKQNKIILNERELSLGAFRETLQELIFDIPTQTAGLKFRPLIKRFIRPKKGSYVSFDKADAEEKNDYFAKLCNGFLLGLAINYIENKRELKNERDRIENLRKNLAQDDVFREFFTGNGDTDIELSDLEEKIAQLSSKLESFQIAENYHEIQTSAHQVERLLQETKNKEFILQNAIDNIDKSLELRPDISVEKVKKVYDETNASLPASVIKHISDVEAFHEKLLKNRLARLSSEKARMEKELKEIRKQIASLNRRRDVYIRFLNTHGAMKDWVTTSNYLAELKSKAQKIKDYKELLQRYSDQIQELNIKLINETQKANRYLNQAESLIAENRSRFRSFSRRFYPDKPGGLTVTNNEGDNQQRFDITAKIQDDASDGINEVKIFCFDMTVLLGQHNHSIKFLFHDSRLFSDIDPRQRATLFKIAYESTFKQGYQYIATVNEDQLESMRSQFTEKEYKQVIEKSIVLELTDESPKSKLLGIQVDMDYE